MTGGQGGGVARDTSLSRRSALGAVAATTVVLAGGCTSTSTRGAAPSATASQATDPVDPDQQLAVDAMADEVRVLERLSRTLRRHPGLAAVLAGTRSVHQEHQALLVGAVHDGGYPSSPEPPGIPAGATAALRAVAAGQEQLADRFRRHAGAARSGAFARVLASMAAAADQQAERLSAAVAQRGARA